MLINFFIYTFQVYVQKLPPQHITEWFPEVINGLMEMYMDFLQYNSHPLPTNTNELLINFATQEQWSVPQLVWTAIALRSNSIPIL